MIIKQGEFMSFAPAELHAHTPSRTAPVRQATTNNPSKPDANHTKTELVQELERLVRENERLTLERDQLREELSRQSLEARRSQRARQIAEASAEPPEVPETEVSATTIENLRRQSLTATTDRAAKPPAPESEDPGYELARVVVNWFWDDADEASVRLVHDALVGHGIRTIVREDAEEDA
jgi:cell division septum initiation protein DivIVA